MTYKTTDFYLACYLRFKGYAYAGLDYDQQTRKATFNFQDVTQADVLRYYNREEEPTAFADVVTAIRQTRELLYNGRVE